MKVAVLGSGNGACATAADFALHGHEVRLWDSPDFPHTIAAVREAGGITASGDLTGTARLAYVGHDAAAALAGAEYVYAVGPAFSTAPMALAVREHLRPEQTVVVMPSSVLGSVVFKQALGVQLSAQVPVIAETSTLPYAVRLTGPTHVTVYLKLRDGVFVASLPGGESQRVAGAMSDVYAVSASRSVFATTLQNGNPVIHPAVTLLNAAQIERTGGDFMFYEDGVTPAVGRLMEAVDTERQDIARGLGLQILSEPALGKLQGYMLEENYSTGYSRAPGFAGIRAQPQLDHRYLNEDVGYGLVFLAELGERVGVPTPRIDAVIAMASIVMGRDYRAEQVRGLAALGLGDYSAEELAAL